MRGEEFAFGREEEGCVVILRRTFGVLRDTTAEEVSRRLGGEGGEGVK